MALFRRVLENAVRFDRVVDGADERAGDEGDQHELELLLRAGLGERERRGGRQQVEGATAREVTSPPALSIFAERGTRVPTARLLLD